MKILIDIRLLGRGGQSGVEEYTSQVINHLITLAPSNFRFQLFYNGWRKTPLPKKWQSASNTEIINWPYPNKLFRLANLKIDRLVKTDLIFSPHLNYLNHSSKVPRVLTIHDLSFLHYKNFFSRKQRLWHFLQNVKRQARRAIHIIADSQYTKKDIEATLQISPEKVSVVYPGINPNIKKIQYPIRQPADKIQHPLIQYPFILYLGTLEPRKNIVGIIKSFNILKKDKKYSDLKLILAGQPGWLFKEIVAEAKNSPCREDIIFWGYVTAEDKILLYNLAEAFIYPSFFEGFGFPVLEAQACRCPVISSNRTSIMEIAGQSAAIVNPWRTDKLAVALNEALSNKQYRDKLIKNGQENAQKYQWTKCATELLKIFSNYSS